MKSKIGPMDLRSVNTMLYELTCLHRWSDVLVVPGKYTEIAKQAFNCMIAFIWSQEAIHEGHSIDFTIFPKVAISRGFVKSFQCDIPETNFDRIFHLGNVSKETFEEMIDSQISKITTESFRQHLIFDSNSLESRIYKGATKLATLLELQEIKNAISLKDYRKKQQQLLDIVSSYSDLPGFKKMISPNYMELFRDFSQLRNRIRWAKHPSIVKCNVLGHLFDTAVFAYLMSLEVNPKNKSLAVKYFFMGIFHDFPEKWTGDMPSPIKDSINGLRTATEEFEKEVMEKYVYARLPAYQKRALKGIMLEDEINASFKKFFKKSDNYSAFIECWRELDSGSHHKYYFDVIESDYRDKEKLPYNFRLLTEELYDILLYR